MADDPDPDLLVADLPELEVPPVVLHQWRWIFGWHDTGLARGADGNPSSRNASTTTIANAQPTWPVARTIGRTSRRARRA
jgi:hypothetical protein